MDKKDQLLLQKCAGTIVGNHKAIKAYWDEIDHFREFGSTPTESQRVLKQNVEDMSIGQIVTLCFTLPQFICKMKKKLKNMADGPEKLQTMLELQIKEAELNEIKNLRE